MYIKGGSSMESLKPAIAELEQRLQAQLRDVAETKRSINLLLKISGERPRYADIDAASGASLSVRPDEYYGQPLSSVVAGILARNKVAGGSAMTVNEIFDAMIRGGYLFDTKNDENSKRILRISLTKNSAKFHKVPGGSWGLREWYPNVKAERVPMDDDGETNGKTLKPVASPDTDDSPPAIAKTVEEEQATDAEA
jgi:hypothetical protein